MNDFHAPQETFHAPDLDEAIAALCVVREEHRVSTPEQRDALRARLSAIGRPALRDQLNEGQLRPATGTGRPTFN